MIHFRAHWAFFKMVANGGGQLRSITSGDFLNSKTLEILKVNFFTKVYEDIFPQFNYHER